MTTAPCRVCGAADNHPMVDAEGRPAPGGRTRVLLVRCPSCDAEPETLCISAKGRRTTSHHAAREQTARSAGLYPPRPRYTQSELDQHQAARREEDSRRSAEHERSMLEDGHHVVEGTDGGCTCCSELPDLLRQIADSWDRRGAVPTSVIRELLDTRFITAAVIRGLLCPGDSWEVRHLLARLEEVGVDEPWQPIGWDRDAPAPRGGVEGDPPPASRG